MQTFSGLNREMQPGDKQQSGNTIAVLLNAALSRAPSAKSDRDEFNIVSCLDDRQCDGCWERKTIWENVFKLVDVAFLNEPKTGERFCLCSSHKWQEIW